MRTVCRREHHFDNSSTVCQANCSQSYSNRAHLGSEHPERKRARESQCGFEGVDCTPPR